MARYHAHAFVDGGYLRRTAEQLGRGWVDPRAVSEMVTYRDDIQTWGAPGLPVDRPIGLTRVTYYDCVPPEGERDPLGMLSYCRAVELLPDTELGLGVLRGGKNRDEQKRVDTQIAVDLVVGAFTGAYSVAIVISGDQDHIPAIQEVKRRGVMVVVAATRSIPGLAPELQRTADRFVELGKIILGSRRFAGEMGEWPRASA